MKFISHIIYLHILRGVMFGEGDGWYSILYIVCDVWGEVEIKLFK